MVGPIIANLLAHNATKFEVVASAKINARTHNDCPNKVAKNSWLTRDLLFLYNTKDPIKINDKNVNK